MVGIQVIAFDFGLNRIGVATGNTLIGIAHPLDTIVGRNKFEKLDKISLLIDKWQPKLLLVGKPTLSQELLPHIEKFANRLFDRFRLEIKFINEDFTSSVASDQLNQQKVQGRSQVGILDQLAACEILNTYFNNLTKTL